MNDAPTPPRRFLIARIAIVLLVCSLVYFPALGRGGLTMSEGHRAIPAWEMLDTGEWLVPHMFSQPYLRKPPGMPWAIAASSVLFGRTELAARLVSAVSATLMAVIALLWSYRWFGPRGAMAAGLAQALMPQMWMWGRTAEIEVLNALGAQIMLFGVLETLRLRRIVGPLALAFGLVFAALAKGPAAAPCLAGAIIAGALVPNIRGALRRPGLWLALAAGAAAIIAGALVVSHRLQSLPAPPVTQGVSSFLWEPDRIPGVLVFPAAAWISALPVSLALLFPWGPGARAETSAGSPLSKARLLAWTWVISIAIYTLAGVSNPRYALPAACTLAPLVGYVLSGVDKWLLASRARTARWMLLGAFPVWVVVLLGSATAYILTAEARTRAKSGRDAGQAIGARIVEVLRNGTIDAHGGRIIVAADQLVEARPEVLAYAERTAQELGVELEPRWTPGRVFPPSPEVPIVILRVDASPESSIDTPGWTPIGDWLVHEFRFRCLVKDRSHVQ